MPRRYGAAVLTSLMLLSAPCTSVQAAPTPTPTPPINNTDNRIESALARQVTVKAKWEAAQARLDAAEAEAGLAAEAYNKARLREQRAIRALKSAKAKAAKAVADSSAAKNKKNQLAAALYMQGIDTTGWEFIFGQFSANQLVSRAAGVDAVEDERNLSAARAARTARRAARAQSDAARAELKARAAASDAQEAHDATQTKLDAAQAAVATIQGEQQTLAAELATLRGSSVEAEVERLMRAGESATRARVLAEAKTARLRTASLTGDSKAAATAIAFAQSQLGEPYVWGGEGPDAWDCSGLTMKAWAAAGAKLTHYTGNQWQETSRVAIADLRPGDLVFFAKDASNTDAIHHVGLYVGDGKMIEAPRTGLNVRYASIYRSSLMPYGGRVG